MSVVTKAVEEAIKAGAVEVIKEEAEPLVPEVTAVLVVAVVLVAVVLVAVDSAVQAGLIVAIEAAPFLAVAEVLVAGNILIVVVPVTPVEVLVAQPVDNIYRVDKIPWINAFYRLDKSSVWLILICFTKSGT